MTSKGMETKKEEETNGSGPIDLESVVKKWAEIMFQSSETYKRQSRIPKEELQYRINWSRVRFEHGNQKTVGRDRLPLTPTTHVLFRTFFTNRTTEDQEFSFQTSRTTTSTCAVSMEQCYTVGEEMNLSVQTPGEVMKASAGFHQELSLTNASEEIIQKTLTWKVDSQVKVPRDKRTVAELVVTEDRLADRFTIVSKISGKLLVTVTNKKDNNAQLGVLDGDIVEIIRGMHEKNKDLHFFTLENDVAEFVSKGRCTFRYAVDQKIDLVEEDIAQTGKEGVVVSQ